MILRECSGKLSQICCMTASALEVVAAARDRRARPWEAAAAASTDHSSQQSFTGRLCFAQNAIILVDGTTCTSGHMLQAHALYWDLQLGHAGKAACSCIYVHVDF